MINNCLIFRFQCTCTLNAFNTRCNPNEIFNSYTNTSTCSNRICVYITVAVINLIFIYSF
uniref:Uncharacterized protein n=1 Tax=Anguilla anguilla TaxID=7936 RepID=A0A0E9WNU5_ANGAN